METKFVIGMTTKNLWITVLFINKQNSSIIINFSEIKDEWPILNDCIQDNSKVIRNTYAKRREP